MMYGYGDAKYGQQSLAGLGVYGPRTVSSKVGVAEREILEISLSVMSFNLFRAQYETMVLCPKPI